MGFDEPLKGLGGEQKECDLPIFQSPWTVSLIDGPVKCLGRRSITAEERLVNVHPEQSWLGDNSKITENALEYSAGGREERRGTLNTSGSLVSMWICSTCVLVTMRKRRLVQEGFQD